MYIHASKARTFSKYIGFNSIEKNEIENYNKNGAVAVFISLSFFFHSSIIL
jgi:hypothetical protein